MLSCFRLCLYVVLCKDMFVKELFFQDTPPHCIWSHRSFYFLLPVLMTKVDATSSHAQATRVIKQLGLVAGSRRAQTGTQWAHPKSSLSMYRCPKSSRPAASGAAEASGGSSSGTCPMTTPPQPPGSPCKTSGSAYSSASTQKTLVRRSDSSMLTAHGLRKAAMSCRRLLHASALQAVAGKQYLQRRNVQTARKLDATKSGVAVQVTPCSRARGRASSWTCRGYACRRTRSERGRRAFGAAR